MEGPSIAFNLTRDAGAPASAFHARATRPTTRTRLSGALRRLLDARFLRLHSSRVVDTASDATRPALGWGPGLARPARRHRRRRSGRATVPDHVPDGTWRAGMPSASWPRPSLLRCCWRCCWRCCGPPRPAAPPRSMWPGGAVPMTWPRPRPWRRRSPGARWPRLCCSSRPSQPNRFSSQSDDFTRISCAAH